MIDGITSLRLQKNDQNRKVTVQATREEYPMLYARFAELVLSGESEADLTPLQMTLDALAVGKRVALPRFEG